MAAQKGCLRNLCKGCGNVWRSVAEYYEKSDKREGVLKIGQISVT